MDRQPTKKLFKELTEQQKKDFVDKFKALPFKEYSIRKALVECDAIIENSDCRVEAMFIHLSSAPNFFKRLIENAKGLMNEDVDLHGEGQYEYGY